jgi:radical SAM protein with 4Fe4S-binding SPASM domain
MFVLHRHRRRHGVFGRLPGGDSFALSEAGVKSEDWSLMNFGKIKPSAGMDDRVPLRRVVPLSAPYALYLYPTNRCNFRCNYCVHALDHRTLRSKYGMDHTDMTLATFKNAAEGLAGMAAPLKTMIFVGQGEPLLNKDLPAMIAYAKEKGISRRVEIITNGSLLTPRVSDALLDAGLDVLRVSVQGMSADMYKKVCGYTMDYSRFIDQLTYFYAARKSGRLYVKVADGGLLPGEEALFYETFGKISDRMFIERIQPVYEGVAYGESPDRVAGDRYGNVHPPRFVCPLPFYMITVWPDGSVAPCEAIYKPVTLGNVNAGSLLDMWKGGALREFWLAQLRYGKNGWEKCRACCAPDDVSHPLDVLDGARDALIKKLEDERHE